MLLGSLPVFDSLRLCSAQAAQTNSQEIMNIPILPTAYFPSIAYFKVLFEHDKVFINCDESFQKQTFRNRCSIANSNGILNLSVPVKRLKGSDSLTAEIQISEVENWRKDHLKAIESAYRRSPYYEFYIEKITSILQTKYNFLHDLNHQLLLFLVDKIGLTVQIEIEAKDFEKTNADYRGILNSKNQDFFACKRYIQPFEERLGFQANLSVLDLLFNEGPNSISILQESTINLP